MIERLATRLNGLLYSSRPSWALMPSGVATNFVDNLLFFLSLLERCEMTYVIHFGTLLGSTRLGGVLPWDEDADIFLVGEDRASVERKIGRELEAHGFGLYYDPGDFFWVCQEPWWAGQGHIGLSFLPNVSPAGSGIPTHHEDPSLPWEHLHPIRRHPFYGTWVWGPAEPEPVIERLYGVTGSVTEMARHRPPSIAPEVITFWSGAREGALAWPAISQRFRERYAQRRYAHLPCFPWWWANGAYNIAIRQLRNAGRRLR